MDPPSHRITRLAPSPTGALHLGNARTFLINWALARQQGWRIVLRIEDLDGPRVKPQAAQQAIDLLRWLGVDWDDGPWSQRHDLAPYQTALEQLAAAGRTYPCTCTRKDITAATSAPHLDNHELRYPGTCRTYPPAEGQTAALRVMVPDENIVFDDVLCGRQMINVQRQAGDFVVATKVALPAYQLAVVVDDAAAAVSDVVRGDDLLNSTGRQLWLQRFLNLGPPPRYYHLPLVLGPDGRRLAKRHGDTRLLGYRQSGVSADRVVGLLSHWCGIIDHRSPMSAADFRQHFDLDRLPREPVRFSKEDATWLDT